MCQILRNLTYILNKLVVVGHISQISSAGCQWSTICSRYVQPHYSKIYHLPFCSCTGCLQTILQSTVRNLSKQPGDFWFKFFSRAVSVSQMKGRYVACFAFHYQWNTQFEESVFILLCLHLYSIVNN